MREIELLGRRVRYALARHPRARSVRLWVGPEGLRVTAPPRLPLREVESAVRSRAAWALAHLVRLDHSVAFWALVGRLHPTWRADREWLDRHSAALRRGPALAPT